MKQPETGGSYTRNPKTGGLTQVERPTVHVNPNDPSTATAPPVVDETEPSKKGN